MFGIGPSELIIILVVALLVLGPKRLPELARSLGRAFAEFRRATADLGEEIDNARVLLEEEARAAARAADETVTEGDSDTRVPARSPSAETKRTPANGKADGDVAEKDTTR